MPTQRMGLFADRATPAVWLTVSLLGAAAWSLSGAAVVGGLVVLAVLAAAASPAGALYASCSAIPLIFHPVTVGSLQLGLLELGLLTATSGLLLRLVYETVENGRLPSLEWLRPYALWLLPALFVAVGTLSLVAMPYLTHRAEALRSWRWVIVEPVLALLLARWAIFRDGPAPLVVAIVLPATVVSLAAVWQLLGSTTSFQVDDVERATATYLHPNNLALYLERAFFLAFVPALLGGRRLRVPLGALSILLFVGLAATFSRGAVLGLVAGGAVLLIAQPIRNGWKALAGGLAAVSVLFLLLARDRLAGAESSGLLTTRTYLWKDAAAMLRDFPVTGIGLDQFLWLHQTRYIDPVIWAERYTSHPHNLILDSWLSLGIAGLATLVLLAGCGAWVTFRIRTGKQPASVWQLGALACLGAGLGHGMVDNGYFLADLAVMTWLSIGLVAPDARQTSESDSFTHA